MRGKRRLSHLQRSQSGITPADAGKTMHPAPAKGLQWDHPRGCGENLNVFQRRHCLLGSPPRMRGKPSRLAVPRFGIRITPADAGKTYFKNNAKTLDEDHPRGCGENPPELSQMNTNIGSPPRMRGKHSRRCHRGKSARITPADAGKT